MFAAWAPAKGNHAVGFALLLHALGFEPTHAEALNTRSQMSMLATNLSIDAFMIPVEVGDLLVLSGGDSGTELESQAAASDDIARNRPETKDAASLRIVASPHGKIENEVVQPYLPYESFLLEFGMPSDRGLNASKASAVEREMLFNASLAAVQAHNSQSPRRSWVATINKFADLTDLERRAHLGYTRAASPISLRRSFSKTNYSAEQEHLFSTQTVDWRERLQSGDFVREQGSCGSCWALTAAGALEAHLELASGTVTKLSTMELVECVQNPQQCGGTGGCAGATAELAFHYASSSGVQTLDAARTPLSRTCAKRADHLGNRALAGGVVRLPINRVLPLLQALAHGPVAVSVAAGPWYSYSSGVFDGCDRDVVVDHAVLAMGYGLDEPTGLKFYIIRNSWGRSWGEGGHMKLLRHDDDSHYCGIDNDPQAGSGCLGGPSEVRVCGMCGILSDSSYPRDVHLYEPASKAAQGFLAHA